MTTQSTTAHSATRSVHKTLDEDIEDINVVLTFTPGAPIGALHVEMSVGDDLDASRYGALLAHAAARLAFYARAYRAAARMDR